MQGSQETKTAAAWALIAELHRDIRRLREKARYERKRAELWKHRALQPRRKR